jgi:hypothetical protein
VMKPLAWDQSFPVDQSFSNNANARPFPVPILSLALRLTRMKCTPRVS